MGIALAAPANDIFDLLQGRNKKGGIMVFAAGNSGVFQDPCSYNDYVNSIYTIAISMINRNGLRSRESQKCPGILAVVYTKDGSTGRNDQSDPMVSMCGILFSYNR